MNLLYRLAEWHALAKLRMHTDSTLKLLDSVTTLLGRELRRFRDITCKAFVTLELEKEEKARIRQQDRDRAKAKSLAPTTDARQALSSATDLDRPDLVGTSSTQPVPLTTKPPRKKKQLNMATYKFHALGDYARTIRMFGTTDSYSTQTVSIFFGITTGGRCLRIFPVGRAGASPCQTAVRKDQQEARCTTDDPT
jgi:hypothetical protein